jgi:GNAT superfamily N-acetyltransferase
VRQFLWFPLPLRGIGTRKDKKDKKLMLTIRDATIADVPVILDFIRGLAKYEREPKAAVATEEDLRRDGFGPNPKYRCVIADWDNRPAGFAFFFYNYSTWRAQHGLYLEDLFVLPEMRGKGIGKALLQHLAQIALRENCYGIRWMVLEWNETALKFYESLGADILGAWETMLLTGPALERLAGRGNALAIKPVETATGHSGERSP